MASELRAARKAVVKALIGLGNPGPRYEATRHNLGYRVVEELARRHGFPRFERRGLVIEARGRLVGEEIVLAKPLTYMNCSGSAVREVVVRHGASADDLIVVHDDLDLELGTVRVRVGGGHGGHNGLRSILEEAGAGEFLRVRLGIAREDRRRDAAEWVLEPFPEEQCGVASEAVARAADAVEAVLRVGVGRAMTEFNRRPRRPEDGLGEAATGPR